MLQPGVESSPGLLEASPARGGCCHHSHFTAKGSKAPGPRGPWDPWCYGGARPRETLRPLCQKGALISRQPFVQMTCAFCFLSGGQLPCGGSVHWKRKWGGDRTALAFVAGSSQTQERAGKVRPAEGHAAEGRCPGMGDDELEETCRGRTLSSLVSLHILGLVWTDVAPFPPLG